MGYPKSRQAAAWGEGRGQISPGGDWSLVCPGVSVGLEMKAENHLCRGTVRPLGPNRGVRAEMGLVPSAVTLCGCGPHPPCKEVVVVL